MATIKITVDNKKKARLLTNFLRNMNFVEKIEEESTVVGDQYEILKKMFNDLEPNQIFREIDDPLKWQKELRNEW